MSARAGTLAQAVQAIQDEAGGLLSLHVIRREDGPRLIAGTLSGDREAAQLLVQVIDLLHRIDTAPASSQMQCGCCGSNLHGGRFAIAIATSDISEPSAGLGMAICRRCGTSLGAIKAAVLTALRCIWPDGRFVTPTHSDGGRA
jgi:hypothetical protein